MASSPLVRITIRSCILSAISNVLAQIITAYRTKTPYTINWTPIVHFVTFALISCPPNFLWQQYLESLFPSKTVHPSGASIAATGSNDEKELDSEQADHLIVEPRLNVRNTVMKFLIDQTVGATMNTILFIMAMAGFRGAGMEEALLLVQLELWPLLIAGARLWPLVSIVSFSVVESVEARNLLGSLAGMAWGVYLSLVAVNH